MSCYCRALSGCPWSKLPRERLHAEGRAQSDTGACTSILHLLFQAPAFPMRTHRNPNSFAPLCDSDLPALGSLHQGDCAALTVRGFPRGSDDPRWGQHKTWIILAPHSDPTPAHEQQGSARPTVSQNQRVSDFVAACSCAMAVMGILLITELHGQRSPISPSSSCTVRPTAFHANLFAVAPSPAYLLAPRQNANFK